MKKYICIMIALVVFTFAAAETSLACSCFASLESVRTQVSKSYDNSTAIFSGKVTSVELTADGNDFVVTFAVKDTWKGTAGNQITVKTARDNSMCGYAFETGKEYLVYTYGTADDMGVSSCSRTSAFPNKADAKYLARLKKKHATKK